MIYKITVLDNVDKLSFNYYKLINCYCNTMSSMTCLVIDHMTHIDCQICFYSIIYLKFENVYNLSAITLLISYT